MTESDKILLDSWHKLYLEILGKLKTIRKEKEMANYPVSQNTENLMYLSEKVIEFTLNAVVQDSVSE